MVMNISCKFEKASYNIFFIRMVTVKSIYTLRRQRNKAKSIVSSGGYNDRIYMIGETKFRIKQHTQISNICWREAIMYCYIANCVTFVSYYGQFYEF